ncbi:hypothetical protein [Clostridium sp.]|uniref:hypothetical protein n=1 Tax=Clostridium sp. TaxID=1506 RepID=UPI0026292847|nr:hypothetical protein [Clostridium sp.]
MEEYDYLNHNQLSIQGDISLQHIIDVEIKREINKHTELTVIGIIDEKEKDTYLDNINYGAEINLKYGTGARETLFGGIIVDVEIKEYKRSYYAIIKAKSSTWILDQKLKKRSFLKDTITYEDILNVMKNDYERCAFVADDKAVQKVDKLIVQYDETDFEFLKRIASHLGMVVIPEDLFNLPRFYFGISQRNSIEIDKEDYKLVRYFDNLAGEKYEYKLISGQVIELGCEIVLDNQSFTVIKSESKLIDSKLSNTYTILESHLIEVPKIYNENIRGTAIKGTIIEPKGTQVRVQLNIDNEDVTNWYDFIVGSNNALYSMPYAGDKVKVYFESNEEEESSVSFATYSGSGLNPDTKFWSNRDGKKVEYTPQTIEISGKSGTLNNSIKFTDSSGIDIKSDLKITIMSAGDLSIKAKNIEITGKQGVSFNHYPNPKEKNTGIPKGITIDATDVSFKVNDAYFEGSEKRQYPVESEPRPTKPKSKAQTKQVAAKGRNEARVESGWKTFGKGLLLGLGAVAMVAAVVVTGGAALAVGAALLEGGLVSTAVGVGVVATAAVGTKVGLDAAEKEGEIADATMDEGIDEINNGENGIDEKGYNRIRDGEFGGDEEKYKEYQDQVIGLWETGVMLNMTAATAGTDLLPAAGCADAYLSNKLPNVFSNMFQYREEELICSSNPMLEIEGENSEGKLVAETSKGNLDVSKNYRQRIDEANARGDIKAANDARYDRYCEQKNNNGQEPLSREEWDKYNERISKNRSSGYEQEPKGREALEDYLDRKLNNNNRGTVELHTSDGNTTRPDSIGRNDEGKIDLVHDHKHLTGEGDQVVYDTDQMRTQRQMLETDDGTHVVTMSSDKPNLEAIPPQPRPSGPLAQDSKVYYTEPGSGKITHEWVRNERLPGGGFWKKI